MNAPLRIVHTEASMGWGGQEIRILAEIEGMRRRGHEITLIAPEGARIVPEAQRRSITTVVLPIGRKRLPGFLALRRWLAAHRVDVINTHSSTDSWLAALACLTLRDAPALVRTRHISAPVDRNFATRWLYLHASAHIATTGESLREALIRDSGVPPERVTSVPTGIDAARFKPGDRAAARAALGLPADHTLVGIVATLRSWKGHRFLFEAIAKLPANRVSLVVVGDGPQREALESLADSLGIKARVFMPGNQADVLPWLQALDVFALPSYANEGVPQALVQAMLCGLPCVTTSVGAIPEAAVDGETAIVVKPQDADDLARGINLLLDDAALRERLGAAARRRCEERFGYEAMLDRMEAIFQQATHG